jgi:hypothetical protein
MASLPQELLRLLSDATETTDDFKAPILQTDAFGPVEVHASGEKLDITVDLDYEQALREALGLSSDQLDAKGATCARGFIDAQQYGPNYITLFANRRDFFWIVQDLLEAVEEEA